MLLVVVYLPFFSLYFHMNCGALPSDLDLYNTGLEMSTTRNQQREQQESIEVTMSNESLFSGSNVDRLIICITVYIIIPPQTVFGGYTVLTLSFRPSVCPQHIKSLNEIHETW